MVSQKSSPVAITVISYITDNMAQKGLFVTPCIIGQLSQIFIGSLLARYFAHLVEKYEKPVLPVGKEEEEEEGGRGSGGPVLPVGKEDEGSIPPSPLPPSSTKVEEEKEVAVVVLPQGDDGRRGGGGGSTDRL